MRQWKERYFDSFYITKKRPVQKGIRLHVENGTTMEQSRAKNGIRQHDPSHPTCIGQILPDR